MLCLCWKRCALLESIVRRVVWVQRFAVYKDLLYVVDMACTNLGGSVGSWISVSFQPQRVISGQTWVGSYAMLLWCCRQCGSYEPRILHGSIYLDPKVHILCLDDVACTNPEQYSTEVYLGDLGAKVHIPCCSVADDVARTNPAFCMEIFLSLRLIYCVQTTRLVQTWMQRFVYCAFVADFMACSYPEYCMVFLQRPFDFYPPPLCLSLARIVTTCF